MPAPAGPARDDGEALAHVLDEGLRCTSRATCPLAVFLSGGIDSSAIANLAQKAARTPIHTFTLAFEEKPYNEGPEARRIAAGDRHAAPRGRADGVGLRRRPRSGRSTASISRRSTGSTRYYMSRAIRQAGFTVALVGTGGDELFGGYPIVPRAAAASSAGAAGSRRATATSARRWRRERSRRPCNRRGAPPFPPQTRWAKLPDMVRVARRPPRSLPACVRALLADFQRELLGSARARGPRARAARFDAARLREETGGRSALGRRQRDGAAAVSRRASPPRQRRGEHGGVDRAAPAPRRPDARSRAWSSYPTPCATSRFRRRHCSAASDCGVSIRRSSSGRSAASSCRSIAGSASVSAMRCGDTMRDGDAVRAAGLDPEAVRGLWRAFQEGAPGIYWSRVWAVYVLIHWCRRHAVSV